MILQIERHWNREPGWLAGQPRAVQSQLIADFRLDHEDPKSRTAKTAAAKRARFDKIRKRHTKQGSI